MRLIPRILIERRAAAIRDPVQRLRYLQGSLTPRSRETYGKFNQLPWLGLALLLVATLIPVYKDSSVKASFPLKPPSRLGPASAWPAANSGSMPHPGAALSGAIAPGNLPPGTVPPGTVSPGAVSSGTVPPDTVPNVWLVDQTRDFETYSNGLRVDDRYVKPNQKRIFYPVYQSGAIDAGQPEWRSEPAGIVYHTTESDQARFTPDQNARLKRIGKAVLEFVGQNHSYHFLIDRFGQVFRIVPESDVANHAGYSVWAEGSRVYVNLNGSFLGVAFETQTQLGDLPSANAAQVHAARVLTEMLRAKYRFPQSSCVTHAQVSVNPGNMLMGYHTDWAGNFPFPDIGLSDNYALPPASIYEFGFDYDPGFVHATGVRLWQGLASAEDRIETQAAARGIPVSRYRAILRKQYKEVLAALKQAAIANDNRHEA